jgi:hypothetical protein
MRADGTDAAFKTFFTDCLNAGPELCVFLQNSTTIEELEKRFYKIYDDISARPILLDDAITFTPVQVNGHDLKRAILLALYTPVSNFPSVAQALVDLEQRNGTLLGVGSGRVLLRSQATADPSFYYAAPVTAQIACIDAAGRVPPLTYEAYLERAEFLANQSFIGGEQWAVSFDTPCTALDIVPPPSQFFQGKCERFDRPFCPLADCLCDTASWRRHFGAYPLHKFPA